MLSRVGSFLAILLLLLPAGQWGPLHGALLVGSGWGFVLLVLHPCPSSSCTMLLVLLLHPYLSSQSCLVLPHHWEAALGHPRAAER